MLHALLDLVLPERCAGCGEAGALICLRCRTALDDPPRLAVPEPCPPGLPPIWATCEYAGAVQRLLIAHKERGRHDLSPLLGIALARAVSAGGLSPRPVLIVPAPSRAASTRSRGYDHAVRLAAQAARDLEQQGIAAVVAPILRQRAVVADQGGLDAATRARNLAGALVSTAPLSVAARVVIVDDVMTTGSTLAEAARALRAAGASDLGGAVVAATRRRHPRRLGQNPPPKR